MRTHGTPFLVVTFATTLAALGCGDDAATPADGDADQHTGEGACGNVDNCIDTVDLEEGLAVEGEEGNFTLTVNAHSALAPEDNVWGVTLTGASGDPVANAKLTVDVWSVDCMHGGPLEAVFFAAGADGTATLNPVAVHGGPWDVIVKVESGSVSDTITIHLCIPGEGHGGTDAHAQDDAG